MVVVDTHLARGASNGGRTVHNRGGPYGRTKGAKRVVAVDVTGLPVGAPVVPAATHENRTTELMLDHLHRHHPATSRRPRPTASLDAGAGHGRVNAPTRARSSAAGDACGC